VFSNKAPAAAATAPAEREAETVEDVKSQ